MIEFTEVFYMEFSFDFLGQIDVHTDSELVFGQHSLPLFRLTIGQYPISTSIIHSLPLSHLPQLHAHLIV